MRVLAAAALLISPLPLMAQAPAQLPPCVIHSVVLESKSECCDRVVHYLTAKNSAGIAMWSRVIPDAPGFALGVVRRMQLFPGHELPGVVLVHPGGRVVRYDCNGADIALYDVRVLTPGLNWTAVAGSVQDESPQFRLWGADVGKVYYVELDLSDLLGQTRPDPATLVRWTRHLDGQSGPLDREPIHSMRMVGLPGHQSVELTTELTPAPASRFFPESYRFAPATGELIFPEWTGAATIAPSSPGSTRVQCLDGAGATLWETDLNAPVLVATWADSARGPWTSVAVTDGTTQPAAPPRLHLLGLDGVVRTSYDLTAGAGGPAADTRIVRHGMGPLPAPNHTTRFLQPVIGGWRFDFYAFSTSVVEQSSRLYFLGTREPAGVLVATFDAVVHDTEGWELVVGERHGSAFARSTQIYFPLEPEAFWGLNTSALRFAFDGAAAGAVWEAPFLDVLPGADPDQLNVTTADGGTRRFVRAPLHAWPQAVAWTPEQLPVARVAHEGTRLDGFDAGGRPLDAIDLGGDIWDAKLVQSPAVGKLGAILALADLDGWPKLVTVATSPGLRVQAVDPLAGSGCEAQVERFAEARDFVLADGTGRTHVLAAGSDYVYFKADWATGARTSFVHEGPISGYMLATQYRDRTDIWGTIGGTGNADLVVFLPKAHPEPYGPCRLSPTWTARWDGSDPDLVAGGPITSVHSQNAPREDLLVEVAGDELYLLRGTDGAVIPARVTLSRSSWTAVRRGQLQTFQSEVADAPSLVGCRVAWHFPADVFEILGVTLGYHAARAGWTLSGWQVDRGLLTARLAAGPQAARFGPGGQSLLEIQARVLPRATRGTVVIEPQESIALSRRSGVPMRHSAQSLSLTIDCRPYEVDWDEPVTASDALLVLRAVVGLGYLDERQRCAGDVDDDGDLTAGDVILILRRVAGLPKLHPEVASPDTVQAQRARWSMRQPQGETVPEELVLELSAPGALAGWSVVVEPLSSAVAIVGVEPLGDGVFAGSCTTVARAAVASATGLHTGTGIRLKLRATAVTAGPGASSAIRIQAGAAFGPEGARYEWDAQDFMIDAQLLPPSLPAMTALHPNHPNPFNPRTTIHFDLAQPARAVLQIFDARGRLVRTLQDVQLPAGAHRVVWDATDDAGRPVASGAYLCRMRAGNVEISRRLMLVR